jgi:hypothetical protein
MDESTIVPLGSISHTALGRYNMTIEVPDPSLPYPVRLTMDRCDGQGLIEETMTCQIGTQTLSKLIKALEEAYQAVTQ